MAKLVVYRGDEDLTLPATPGHNYIYKIGAGKINGTGFTSINDSTALNEIAISIRDEYTNWIYSLNQRFVSRKMIRDGLSLFFLTDLSNKRNELFDTYESISNLILIRKRLANEVVDTIDLIGMDIAFRQSICSVFPRATINTVKRKYQRIQLARRFVADTKYLSEIALVVIINMLLLKRTSTNTRTPTKHYFAFFPQTFDERNRDLRYGDLVSEDDKYLVTLVADGMHQQVDPLSYWRYVSRLPPDNFVLIDAWLRMSDIGVGLFWLVKSYWFLVSERKQRYNFNGIEISRFIRQELVWSSSRIARLVLLIGPLRRVINSLNIKELVYLNFEYAFGRMISFVLGKYFPEVVRTGFNHGDYSWRFLNYFLAKGEARQGPPYIDHCPIPDKVLAEDELCADIYEYNGYQCVEIMKEVNRLKYLEKIIPTRLEKYALIAGGLHDGSALLACLREQIVSQPETEFLFKPHPRSRNSHIEQTADIPNLKIVNSPIEDLLKFVGRIYVTYSGVGVEGWRLGIPVTLVDMPGRISWSKLLDYDQFKLENN